MSRLWQWLADQIVPVDAVAVRCPAVTYSGSGCLLRRLLENGVLP